MHAEHRRQWGVESAAGENHQAGHRLDETAAVAKAVGDSWADVEVVVRDLQLAGAFEECTDDRVQR